LHLFRAISGHKAPTVAQAGFVWSSHRGQDSGSKLRANESDWRSVDQRINRRNCEIVVPKAYLKKQENVEKQHASEKNRKRFYEKMDMLPIKIT
jgi:hypothetical protein